jgi:ParB-like chromosome segregation protein Spo0J
MIESIKTVPLDLISVCPGVSQAERRKRFDKAAIAELAESIKSVGLLQPPKARKAAKTQGKP